MVSISPLEMIVKNKNNQIKKSLAKHIPSRGYSKNDEGFIFQLSSFSGLISVLVIYYSIFVFPAFNSSLPASVVSILNNFASISFFVNFVVK